MTPRSSTKHRLDAAVKRKDYAAAAQLQQELDVLNSDVSGGSPPPASAEERLRTLRAELAEAEASPKN